MNRTAASIVAALGIITLSGNALAAQSTTEYEYTRYGTDWSGIHASEGDFGVDVDFEAYVEAEENITYGGFAANAYTGGLAEAELFGETIELGYLDMYAESGDSFPAAGYEVREEKHEDMSPIKRRLGVPDDMASCHTTVIDGYVVEGHVPLETIERLLAERPEIHGIALPGMPTGVPGMPGERPERLEVLKLGADAGEIYSVE